MKRNLLALITPFLTLLTLSCASSAKQPDARPNVQSTNVQSTKVEADNARAEVQRSERPHFFVSTKSPHSLEQTLEKVRAAIAKRPLTLFAEIDHSAGAKGAGLKMPGSVLFIFGNPKGGTPLMLQNPDIALELPLRLLVREDESEGVVLVHRDTLKLAPHYGLDPSKEPLPKISQMLAGLVAEVTKAE